jgi:hypothetical protein
MAMSITADSLLPRPKLDCDVGYNMATKGASIVVSVKLTVRMKLPSELTQEVNNTRFNIVLGKATGEP